MFIILLVVSTTLFTFLFILTLITLLLSKDRGFRIFLLLILFIQYLIHHTFSIIHTNLIIVVCLFFSVGRLIRFFFLIARLFFAYYYISQLLFGQWMWWIIIAWTWVLVLIEIFSLFSNLETIYIITHLFSLHIILSCIRRIISIVKWSFFIPIYTIYMCWLNSSFGNWFIWIISSNPWRII